MRASALAMRAVPAVNSVWADGAALAPASIDISVTSGDAPAAVVVNAARCRLADVPAARRAGSAGLGTFA